MAATLSSTASVEEQWRDVADPWLRKRARMAWKDSRPTVVITPSRAEGFYLRSRLVGEGTACLGLHFWTPSDARQFLVAKLRPECGPATQADLRLLARTCAEKLAAGESSDRASIASVARDPDAFLRAYDLLLGAGWNPEKDGAPFSRALAREFQRALARNRIATQAGLHRELRLLAGEERPALIANLLVIGFNGTHWPLWDLLKAVVLRAQESVVSLQNPRKFAEDIDQLWHGSWEEFSGRGADTPGASDGGDSPQPFADLIASYEVGTSKQKAEPSTANLTFLAAADLASQTRAVVLQALAYLRDGDCTRLGIVFPSANALALGVAEELRRLGVPLDDGAGEWMPGPFEQLPWQAWLALQEEPGVPNLIAWMRACEARGVACGLPDSLTARRAAERLDAAVAETLVDDLAFLARHFQHDQRLRESPDLAKFLRARVALPRDATFAAFLDLTRRALVLPGWEEHAARLNVEPPAWLSGQRRVMPRRVFLEWLRETTASQMRTRGADGNHFYGKVHLVIYAQMTGQTWSHLILTGLNEGVWPRLREPGAFGSRYELAQLNARVRELNPHGRREGGQGAGHETVAPGHAHCLLPLEQQDLALRDLCAALDSTTVAASLAAMTAEGGRSLLASDFFNHAYQFHTGRMLGDEEFRELANATEAWCRRHDFLFARDGAVDSDEIASTRIAYVARRDAGSPFGPYEFSFATPPAEPIQLTCKKWEEAWRHPASVWLKEIIGAAPWPEGEGPWPVATGNWVHRWLALALREWGRQRRSEAELLVLIWEAARHDADAVRTGVRESGATLCPWWEQVWAEARTLATQLGESLAPVLPEHEFLSEFVLRGDLLTALPGSPRSDFQLKGRIDFLRIDRGEADRDPAHPNFSGCDCWIVDFKTGASKKLTVDQALKGAGLQPVLYALAVRRLGAEAVAMSLLAPGAELKPQLQLSAGLDPILASLETLHRRGVFGMRPDASADYGFSPEYPMATQFVPAYILEAKWALTHGPTAEDET